MKKQKSEQMKYLSRDRISNQKPAVKKILSISPKFFLLIPCLKKITPNYFSVTQVTHLNFPYTQTHLYIHLVIMFCCFQLSNNFWLYPFISTSIAPTLVQAFIIYHLGYCLNSELNFIDFILAILSSPVLTLFVLPPHIAVSKHAILLI